MSDEKKIDQAAKDGFKHHPIFGLWAQEDDSDKQAFVIRCQCGETIYYLEKDLFVEPEGRIFPGMTINDFQKMHKNFQKFKGLRRQIQRVALAQHAESYPDCDAVKKLKEDAGVSSVKELPSPFRDA